MQKKKINFIVVTGGVLSGVGKGIITSSIGNLISNQGYKVSIVKIDPYINIDAGTMRPTEHGEVWVTEDGGETDQDLGNYERFTDREVSKRNNITTGQVYQTVLQKERNLEYGGRTVEVIPHIPDEIRKRVIEAGEKEDSDFVIVEIGGTVGDYQSVLFLEAMRHLKVNLKENVFFVHVAFLPIPANLGEMKTKPAQHSVTQLAQVGINPDIIIGRSSLPLDDIRKKKLSLFCNVNPEFIFSAPDVEIIYEIPIILEDQKITEKIFERLNLSYRKSKKFQEWKQFIERIKNINKKIKIGIIGKYFDIGDFSLEDSYISVIEAVKHASWKNGVNPEIIWIDSKEFEKDKKKVEDLDTVDAVIIPGGFGSSGVEGKIIAIEYARKNNIPFLGLCYGLQLAVVEFSRNVCGMDNANSSEINEKTEFPVIDIMPEQKEKIQNNHYGATMRLGGWEAVLKKDSLVHQMYGKDRISERHRHRYEVNPEYIEKLESKGMVFSGKSLDGKLMEFIELPGHKFFVATQAHPEFKSRPLKPAPLFDGLIKAALRK